MRIFCTLVVCSIKSSSLTPYYTFSRIVKSKPIIQALQSWVLQEPITNLSIAIKSLQALNCLPWNINLLQEHKLGRMLKKATSLSDDPGYQKELYTLFESISTLIDAETIKGITIGKPYFTPDITLLALCVQFIYIFIPVR